MIKIFVTLKGEEYWVLCEDYKVESTCDVLRKHPDFEGIRIKTMAGRQTAFSSPKGGKKQSVSQPGSFRKPQRVEE